MRYTIYADGKLLYDSSDDDRNLPVVSPKVKLEMGKSGSCSFGLLPSHRLYNSLTKLKTEIVVNQDSEEIFRGRVYEISTDIYKQRTVTCEGNLAFLADTLQPPDRTKKTVKDTVSYHGEEGDYSKEYSQQEEEGVKETNKAHFEKLISRHNAQVEPWKRFTVGTVNIAEASEQVTFDASNYRDTLNAIESDLTNYYSGFLRTRRSGNTTYIDWIKDYGSTSTQTIDFGINMIEMTEDSNAEDIFTVLVPIGDDGLTISEVNGGKIGIENANGISKYGKIYKTESFSGISDANKLKQMGQTYMNKNYKDAPVKFSIKALDRRLLDQSVRAYHVGDKIRVISKPHGIDRTVECLSIDIDMQSPENTSYELGDPEQTFSQRWKNDSNRNANDAADAASSARTAGGNASQHFRYIKENATDVMIHGDTLVVQNNKITANAAQIILNTKEIDAHEAKLKVMTVTGGLAAFSTNVQAPKGIFTSIYIGRNTYWVERDWVVGGSVSVSTTIHGPEVTEKLVKGSDGKNTYVVGSVGSVYASSSATLTLDTIKVTYLSGGGSE